MPGFSGTPEPVETIALVCKAAELMGLWQAVAIGWPDQIAAWIASVKALMREPLWAAPKERTVRWGFGVEKDGVMRRMTLAARAAGATKGALDAR